jgi:undecaprenyl diphosphate synthase
LTETTGELKIPKHIGFIMDGNRRWAKEKGLPTLEGHRVGLNDAVYKVLDGCLNRGVQHVTLFGFSTENWDRSKEEISYLIKLFRGMINEKLDELHEKQIKLNFIGHLSDWPTAMQKDMARATELTKDNKKMTVNAALSYGGRPEIVDATKRIIEDGLKPEEITEAKFAEYIYEAGQPDPDVIVRTSGEQRISGFMLWQSAYAELYFTDKYWPDFDEAEVDKVIQEYNHRERRFGK